MSTKQTIIAKLEGIIEKLKGLPEDTIIRQYEVSSTGDTKRITCDYQLVIGNESEDIYRNVDTYLNDEYLEEVRDDIGIMCVVERET